jgi:hypothetical protein
MLAFFANIKCTKQLQKMSPLANKLRLRGHPIGHQTIVKNVTAWDKKHPLTQLWTGGGSLAFATFGESKGESSGLKPDPE